MNTEIHPIVFYYPENHAAHREAQHPERPERVEAVRQALQTAGWWQAYPHVEPLPVSPAVLEAIHTPAYLARLQAAVRRGERLDHDTYTTPVSWEVALAGAGGGLAVARAVWRGEARRGFALTRPPGHHATRSQGMGFCLLNSIALAAEGLLQEDGARRLAIVDLDLHHGNGTQDIFWQREAVLFISVHQSPLYPGTGSLEETGAGPGQGTTANFPLPPGSGDQAYQTVMDELILPLLARFAPEMILVSFGFDPHWRDPLGQLRLSAAVYGQLVGKLAQFADSSCAGRIALFLEGGYDLDAAAACGQAVTAALLGQPWSDPVGPSPHPEGKSWRSVVARAHQIWGV